MIRSLTSAALLAASATLAVGPPPAPTGATLAVSGRSNATPTIAALGHVVAVAWGAATPQGSTDVYAAVSRDGGRTFEPPSRVNDVDGNASLGGEQPPHVALVPRAGARPDVVVVWTAKSPSGTRLLSARSTDGGTTFSRAAPLPGGEAPGNRGWESAAVDREGKVVAVWLDHRELAAASTTMNHDHSAASGTAASAPKPDGAVRAQSSKLYFSRLNDPASARAIASGVCYCCKTSVTATSDGSIYAVWRHVYPGNLRDIAFTASHDGGRTFAPPARVSEDGWAIDGCPENGPTVAAGAGGTVSVVWPTLVRASAPNTEPGLRLFYATTADGHRFTARLPIPTHGTPRHPQMSALADGSFLIVWDEGLDGGRRRVAGVRTTSAGAAPRFTALALDDGTRAEYPVVARSDGGAVLAWTSGLPEQSVIRVARVP